jgi:hypothetical protein
MTYGYGSRAGGWDIGPKNKRRKKPKARGMTEQVVDVLEERGMSTKGAHKFAKAIYDATEELMPAAKAVRDFVEKTASICAKYNAIARDKKAAGATAALDDIIGFPGCHWVSGLSMLTTIRLRKHIQSK